MIIVWQIAALLNGGMLVRGLLTGEMLGVPRPVRRDDNDYAFWFWAFVNAILTATCVYFGLGG
jgi:hypothetical protein